MERIYESYSIFNYKEEIIRRGILLLSTFLEHNNFDPKNNYHIIYMDISMENLINNIAPIVNNLIYILYYYHYQFIFITKYSLKEFVDININNKTLHTDQKKIINKLLLEQFINLLKLSSIIIDDKHIISKNRQQSIEKQSNYQLETLNSNQMNTVLKINGPFLLLAPAGSGKTKTLVNRFINLLNQGICAENILVLAFNKKAQKEIEDRLQANFNLTYKVKTFHSFGNKLIKDYFHYDFDITKQDAIKRMILSNIIKRNISTTEKENYFKKISEIKNTLLTKSELNDKSMWKIFEQYLSQSETKQFYDFDDMLYLPIKILLNNPLLREKIQMKYQYILIDEFQDLNKVQWLLVNILAKPQNNLFVVGDDDQMIYRFRGADDQYILNFNKYYPFHFKEVLTINYRSYKNIVKNAKKLIDYNKKRIYKEITPFSNTDGNINLIVENSMKNEAIKIVEYIKKYKNQYNNYNDLAIIYRYNQYGDYISVILKKNNIPVNYNKLAFLSSSTGKLIINYLSVIYETNPATYDLYSVLTKPNKNLPYEYLKLIKNLNDLFDKNIASDNLNSKQRAAHEKFVSIIKRVRINNQHITIRKIIELFALDQYFLSINNVDEEISNSESLKIILLISDIVGNSKSFYYYSFSKQEKMGNDTVNLTTIHKTKGNEYKNVIFYHVINTENNNEDERKLFYVAISRPKQQLLITSISKKISPFIKEYFLDKQLINYDNDYLEFQIINYLKNKIYKNEKKYCMQKRLIKINVLIDKYNQQIQIKQQLVKSIQKYNNEITYRQILIN
ncbi:MAG: ATP-dependent helicase [Bacilli bacterium]